jgi:hypothetical protein
VTDEGTALLGLVAAGAEAAEVVIG